MYYLKFLDLWNCGHAYVFPCDSKGACPLDEYSERMKNNYYYAKSMVGKQFQIPIIVEVKET